MASLTYDRKDFDARLKLAVSGRHAKHQPVDLAPLNPLVAPNSNAMCALPVTYVGSMVTCNNSLNCEQLQFVWGRTLLIES